METPTKTVIDWESIKDKLDARPMPRKIPEPTVLPPERRKHPDDDSGNHIFWEWTWNDVPHNGYDGVVAYPVRRIICWHHTHYNPPGTGHAAEQTFAQFLKTGSPWMKGAPLTVVEALFDIVRYVQENGAGQEHNP